MDLQNRQTHEIPQEPQSLQQQFYRQTYDTPNNEFSNLKQEYQQKPEIDRISKTDFLFNKQLLVGFLIILLLILGFHLFRQVKQDIINQNLGPILHDQRGSAQSPQINTKLDSENANPTPINIQEDEINKSEIRKQKDRD